METRHFFYVLLGVFFMTGIASIGFAQSNSCTVMENQGGLVTVSCPGEGPKVINMGGSADIYKPGDSITVPEQTKKDLQVRPRTR